MKKTRVIVLAALVCAVGLITAPASAAFTSLQTAVSSAVVSVGGSPTVSFSLALRVLTSTTTPKTIIDWGAVNAGTGWKVSSTTIMLDYSVTNGAGGIQLYTNNKSAGGTTLYPRFFDPTTDPNPNDIANHNLDSNPAGLLWSSGLATSSRTLSMAWTIKTSTKVVELSDPVNGLGASDPTSGPISGYNNRFQWVFMRDKQTPAIDFNGNGTWPDPGTGEDAFVDGEAGSTIADSNGVHYGQAPTEFTGPNTGRAWIYLQASFNTALAGATYRTNTVTVESFTE
ncbi:MAG: hypothetical protein LHV69_03330 [Elusimicrobia bacterium]|nr:hypothetical protein [Candidatus Obscuribacterium magneticum]